MKEHVIIEFLILWMSLSCAVPGEILAFGFQTDGLLFSDHVQHRRRCQYSKTSTKMLQAVCAELGLKEIPASLRTDVEILDLSSNRLRNFNNQTLAAYTSLSTLYLTDNIIRRIDDGVFSHLRNLIHLNLDSNSIFEFPKSLLTLPKLKRLFLSMNDMEKASIESTSFAEDSNIEIMDLSQNKLTSLPHIGILPQLKYLNVSANLIKSIRTEEISIFCSLQTLDISNNPLSLDYCSCISFNDWIKYRNITIYPAKIKCNNNNAQKCQQNDPNSLERNDTLRLFDECNYVIKLREQTAKARSTWILVASCISVFLTLLFIVLYCIHRRNRRKRMKNIHDKKEQLQINNVNTELLNDKNPIDDA